MRQFFQSRHLRYQIVVLLEDRWEITEVVGDGRESLASRFEKPDYEELEKDVERRARVALTKPGAKAVKVLRERILDNKTSIETEILKIDAPPVTPAERLLGNCNDSYPICNSANDLLFRPALHAIGLTLRPFLDRYDLTAIELITLKATNRRLQNLDRAINEAVSSAGRQQATILEMSSRDRKQQLEAFVQTSFLRLRAAECLSKPPKLNPNGMGQFVEAVLEHVPADDQRFWLFRGLSDYVHDSKYGISKLELLVGLRPESVSGEGIDTIDEMIACLIDQPETVKQLLGNQRDLRAALFALAALSGGAPPTGHGVPDIAARLAALIGQDLLPKTRGAVWDRILRTIEGNRQFVNKEPKDEWAALDQIKHELLPIIPSPLQMPAAQAIELRVTQVRQQLLGRT